MTDPDVEYWKNQVAWLGLMLWNIRREEPGTISNVPPPILHDPPPEPTAPFRSYVTPTVGYFPTNSLPNVNQCFRGSIYR
jgi:hypothetical protein